MPNVFQTGDRVRVNMALTVDWHRDDADDLADRIGTVIIADNRRVIVSFDPRKSKGDTLEVEFTNAECLVKTGQYNRSPLVLPDLSGVGTLGKLGKLSSKAAWLSEKTPEGSAGPPPMPLRMGEGPKRRDVEQRIRKAARWAIKVSTRYGEDRYFDPDEMVQNFVTGLIGYNTIDGLGQDWENPSPVPREFRP
jgi:hypothetical protein